MHNQKTGENWKKIINNSQTIYIMIAKTKLVLKLYKSDIININLTPIKNNVKNSNHVKNLLDFFNQLI